MFINITKTLFKSRSDEWLVDQPASLNRLMFCFQFFVNYFNCLMYFFVRIFLFCFFWGGGDDRPIFCYIFAWLFWRANFFLSGQVVDFFLDDDGMYRKAKSRSRWSTYLRLSNIGLHLWYNVIFTKRSIYINCMQSSDLWHLKMDYVWRSSSP